MAAGSIHEFWPESSCVKRQRAVRQRNNLQIVLGLAFRSVILRHGNAVDLLLREDAILVLCDSERSAPEALRGTPCAISLRLIMLIVQENSPVHILRRISPLRCTHTWLPIWNLQKKTPVSLSMAITIMFAMESPCKIMSTPESKEVNNVSVPPVMQPQSNRNI